MPNPKREALLARIEALKERIRDPDTRPMDRASAKVTLGALVSRITAWTINNRSGRTVGRHWRDYKHEDLGPVPKEPPDPHEI